MAKRRTKKQKQAAKNIYTYSDDVASSIDTTKSTPKNAARKTISAWDLYSYDTGLIKSDLIKTVSISAVILTLEIALYVYIR